MGAKYIPTIKDQKHNQRYHSRKSPLPVFRKDAPATHTKSVPASRGTKSS